VALDLVLRDPQAAQFLLLDLRSQSQAAIADIRRLVYDLRPPALDEMWLVGGRPGIEAFPPGASPAPPARTGQCQAGTSRAYCTAPIGRAGTSGSCSTPPLDLETPGDAGILGMGFHLAKRNLLALILHP
jgi:hypothetical protein